MVGVDAVNSARSGVRGLPPAGSTRVSDTRIAGVDAVIPAQAGIIFRTVYVRRPSPVIPVQAEIHGLPPAAFARVPDTPIAGVPAVLPAG